MMGFYFFEVVKKGELFEGGGGGGKLFRGNLSFAADWGGGGEGLYTKH